MVKQELHLKKPTNKEINQKNEKIKIIKRNYKIKMILYSIFIILIIIIPSYYIFVIIRNDQAEETYDKGLDYYTDRNYEKAIEKWQIIHDDYKGTVVWGKATYNIGIAYMDQKEYKKAIPYFNDVINSDKNDFKSEPLTYPTYNGYRHESCKRISECFEKLGNYDVALKYANLAENKYEDVRWFEPLLTIESEPLRSKIQRLKIFRKWYNNNEEFLYEFDINYEILVEDNIEYQLYLPFPISMDKSSSFFINNVKEAKGFSKYEVINTKYGKALNLSCIGNCYLKINYILKISDNISNNKIFHKLSLDDEYDKEAYYSIWSYYYQFYFSSKNNNPQNIVSININGSWIEYPPEWKYNYWRLHESKINNGWNNIQFEIDQYPLGYEERPTGGYCLEYDYERNTLLIGAEDGLGIYNLDNGSYQLITPKYNDTRISAIAIDYINDIYYFGTYTSGIKKYYVEKNRLEENLIEFQNFQFIRKLAYDSHSNKLLIYDYHDFTNIPYYDTNSQTLFTYNENKLLIRNYINNTIKTINNITEVLTFIGYHGYNDVDFAYDFKLNILYLSLQTEFGDRSSLNWDVLIYNLNTDQIEYIILPEFHKNNIIDLSLDYKRHEIYIASSHGLYKYNYSTGNYTKLAEDLTHSIASVTYDFTNDVIYFSYSGTEPSFLYRFDPSMEEILYIE
jgi:hypothetical protein